MENYIDRPAFPGFRLGHRDAIRLQRAQSAWDLAHFIAENVTEDEYNTAFDLLNRCTRYALAQIRHDESETEYNHDSPYRRKQERLLDARRERLKSELARYGCGFHVAGCCCTNVYRIDAERHTVTSGPLLHFFNY